jgi:hypothetical protein
MRGSNICNFLGTVSFILNLLLKIRRNVYMDLIGPPPPNLFSAELVLMNERKLNVYYNIKKI